MSDDFNKEYEEWKMVAGSELVKCFSNFSFVKLDSLCSWYLMDDKIAVDFLPWLYSNYLDVDLFVAIAMHDRRNLDFEPIVTAYTDQFFSLENFNKIKSKRG